MDNKRIYKRFRSVGDPAKCEAAENCGESLDFGFTVVHQRKWDSLQPKRLGSEFAALTEQDPAAEDKLPADQI